jgi:hypothetical protein
MAILEEQRHGLGLRIIIVATVIALGLAIIAAAVVLVGAV